MRSISSGENPASESRTAELSRTMLWAQGQAVIPVASAPMAWRVRLGEATATPISVTSSCVRSRLTGVVRSTG